MTYVRKYEGKPAVDAFKEILVIGEERPRQYTADDIDNYRELAQLQMARVFYSTQQFDTSIKYFEKLPQDSADWAESLFEASWAYFMKTLNSKALGNIHTLNAPYFENQFYPGGGAAPRRHLFQVLPLRSGRGGDRRLQREVRPADRRTSRTSSRSTTTTPSSTST